MPQVFHAHYANRAGHDDVVVATGRMEIWQSRWMQPFAFLFRWTKTLVPVRQNDIATTVMFRTRKDESAFWYERRFDLGNGRQVEFVSRLEHRSGDQVIEWTGSGIGWWSTFTFEEGRVVLSHLGYRVRLAGFEQSLPLTWLFGRPSAWEEAVSENEFRMEMSIDHPLLGRIYSYAGHFRIEEIALEQ